MQVDMQIGNIFKAMCKLRKVDFEYGEQQGLKAQAVGLRRGYKKQVAIWADEHRVVWWDWESEVAQWDDYNLRLTQFRWDEIVKEQAVMAKARLEAGKGKGKGNKG